MPVRLIPAPPPRVTFESTCLHQLQQLTFVMALRICLLLRADSRHCGCGEVVPERNRRHLCEKNLLGQTASVPVEVLRGLVHHFLVLANIILPARSQKDTVRFSVVFLDVSSCLQPLKMRIAVVGGSAR